MFQNPQGSTFTTEVNKGSFTIDSYYRKTGANIVANINAKFIANGIKITATYANQNIFRIQQIFPFEFIHPESTCFDEHSWIFTCESNMNINNSTIKQMFIHINKNCRSQW